MGILKDIGIVKSNSMVAGLFESIFDNETFINIQYTAPSEYVNKYWEKFNEKKYTQAINGKMFELILQTLFIREGLFPLYLQASVAFVPNVRYDSLLYSNEVGPISLSMKTSLRERYKQADLEAIALKYVHRKAKCFLLTMNAGEAKTVREKITAGDVIGIDRVVVCSCSDIDELIRELKSYAPTEAGSVDIISNNQVITKSHYTKFINK
jgi:hypothetical protein